MGGDAKAGMARAGAWGWTGHLVTVRSPSGQSPEWRIQGRELTGETWPAGLGQGRRAGLSVHLTCPCSPGPALVALPSGAGMVLWNFSLSSLGHKTAFHLPLAGQAA